MVCYAQVPWHKESKAMADWDKGAYKQNWENAMHLAGDDRYKRALALGLHNLTAQIEIDMASIHAALTSLRGSGNRA
jgi:hypothetical protein